MKEAIQRQQEVLNYLKDQKYPDSYNSNKKIILRKLAASYALNSGNLNSTFIIVQEIMFSRNFIHISFHVLRRKYANMQPKFLMIIVFL